MKKKYAIACGVLLSACAFYGWVYVWPEHKAESAVKSALNDPDSAKFFDVKFHRKTGGSCGFVNAKTPMGGFAGKTKFALSEDGILKFDPKEITDSDSPERNVVALKKQIEFLKFAIEQCPDK